MGRCRTERGGAKAGSGGVPAQPRRGRGRQQETERERSQARTGACSSSSISTSRVATCKCKWCGAEKGISLNTLGHQYSECTTVVWGRDKSLECLICRNVAVQYNKKPGGKNSVLAGIRANNQEIIEEHQAKRQAWAEIFNASNKGYVKGQNLLGLKPQQETRQCESSALVAEELHGWLWPVKQFTKHVGRKPERSIDRIASIKHKGQWVAGVVLDPADHEPVVGCIKITSRSENRMELNTTLDDSALALSDEQVAETYAAGVKATMGVKATTPQRTAKRGRDDDNPDPGVGLPL